MDWFVIVLSAIAGVVGTGLGGVVGALLKNRGARTMGRVLGFAGGVMAGVVAFEMIPEAISSCGVLGKAGGISLAVGVLISGMAVIGMINKILDVLHDRRDKNKKVAVHARGFERIRILSAALPSEEQKRGMIKAGVVMLIAIALHNFPEGMAIGASGTLGLSTGALVAIIIAIHNIPEGMAIAAPLVSGGVSGIKSVILTMLAGSATVLGAVVGAAVGGLGNIATGVCLALAGGAMMYVTFCEILPESAAMNDGEIPSVSILFGLILSVVFVFAF